MLKLLLISVLVVGCAAETTAPVPTEPVKPNENNMAPNSGNHTIPCPSPLTFTIIRDGKEVVNTYHFPCSYGDDDPLYKRPVSDGPWDEDGSKNGGGNNPFPNPGPDPF